MLVFVYPSTVYVHKVEKSVLGARVPDVYVISATTAQNALKIYRWIQNDLNIMLIEIVRQEIKLGPIV